MRVRRHQDDPWNDGFLAINKLRSEIGAEQAIVDAKRQRVAELMRLMTDDADAETIRALIAQPLPAFGPARAPSDPPPRPTTVTTAEPIDSGTRKNRVILALHEMGRPASPNEVTERVRDEYSRVYTSLNDMRFAEKNGGFALVVRDSKLWSLTDSGRKEAERLLAKSP